MKSTKTGRLRTILLVGVALCVPGATVGCRAKSTQTPVVAPQAQVDPFKDALARVEEERGEPVGREVDVEVPVELKHYSDRRKFLAIQTAEEAQSQFTMPHDYAELASMIKANQLVELPLLGDNYLLYGVGENATDEPITHYDRKTGLSVALCSTDEEFKTEATRLEDGRLERSAVVSQLQHDSRSLGKRDRAKRRVLAGQIAATRRHISQIIAEEKLLKVYSENRELTQLLASEKRGVESLARDFAGESYDLNDPASRRNFKMRLLRFIRLEARAELEEIAASYHEKYNRPLPVTSLIRTEEYQRRLSEWNRNAARNSSPPHVTGLAFDVYYHFMAGSEQAYLMSFIADLKRDGRVEALRESRDHIHVFSFPNGQRPDETLVAKAISETRSQRFSTRATARRSRIRRST